MTGRLKYLSLRGVLPPSFAKGIAGRLGFDFEVEEAEFKAARAANVSTFLREETQLVKRRTVMVWNT
jgi:hypothetical protein